MIYVEKRNRMLSPLFDIHQDIKSEVNGSRLDNNGIQQPESVLNAGTSIYIAFITKTLWKDSNYVIFPPDESQIVAGKLSSDSLRRVSTRVFVNHLIYGL